MGYHGCLGLMRLAKEYSPARMEAAVQRALLTGACRYQSVKSIQKLTGLAAGDHQSLRAATLVRKTPGHAATRHGPRSIRGSIP